MRKIRTTTKLLAIGIVAVLAGLLAATVPAAAAKKQSSEPVTLRLGYFPNVTHAPAIVGVEEGIFEKALGKNVTLDLHTFNSGTEALAAFQAGRSTPATSDRARRSPRGPSSTRA